MAGYQNPYLSENNPYLQGQIDLAQNDLARNYNNVTQPAYNSAMVKSGSFGNEGVNQANANSQQNLTNSMGRIGSDMRSADYRSQQDMYRWDQGFNRDLFNDAYTQGANNLQQGIGLLGTLNGYNQQDLNNATTIQNTPLNYYGQFANTANGIGNGYSTDTTRIGTTSNPLVGAMGGMQLGQSLWNQYQRNNGGSTYDSGFNGQSNPANQAGLDNLMNQFAGQVGP